MKSAFLIGGILGFVLAATAGLSAGRPADRVLRDAAIACVAGGLVCRWFWQVLIQAFTEVVTERREEHLKAIQEAQEEQEAAQVKTSVATRRR